MTATAATIDRPARVRRVAAGSVRDTSSYDAWFRAKVQEGLDEPGPGIPHEVVKAEFAAKREALRRRIEAEGL